MPHDRMTVVDFRPDTSEQDDQSEDTTTPRPTTPTGGLPSFPGFFLVLLLGLGLLVVGLLLSTTPPA
jgi:hypothetical protein